MDATQFIIWSVVWAVFWGRIAYEIGKKKGEGTTACIGGVLLGPIGVLMAVVSKGDRATCPFCKSLIDPAASVCSHCQRDIPGKQQAA
ncbi:MAG: hypothetical protein GX139_12520 [Armatimonadetes bacterium]|nr:hypothetical protein [Armatimonadota bacterium]